MVKRTIDADDLISYMEYAINSCHYEKMLIKDNLTVADVIRALIKDIDKMADVLYKPTNSEEIPTVEAIPKDQYEARLKADMVAMLEEIELELDEVGPSSCDICIGNEYQNLIQQKINALKGESK